MAENNSIKILKTGGILCGITAVAALLLAFVNSVTAPIIEENTQKKTQLAMKNVMAAADKFEKADITGENPLVTEVYIALKENGENVGYCISVSPNGYGGAIDMMVGVEKTMRVSGVDIINHSETAGLGSKAAEPEFRQQFVGKKKIEKVVKSAGNDEIIKEQKENEIDAITSATITSKAVTDGVNAAISEAELLSAK